MLELYFAQNRFYDPADRRFTQEDIVKDSQNWYAYCGNNPTLHVDPWGLAVNDITTFIPTSEIKDGAGTVIEIGTFNREEQKDDFIFQLSCWEWLKSSRSTFEFLSNIAAANNYYNVFSCPMRMSKIASNYEQIKALDNRDSNGQLKLIYGQGRGEVAGLPYGGGKMSDNGCGVIAAYNALLLLNNPKELADVALFFEINGAVLNAKLGTNPAAFVPFFESFNYKVKTVYADEVGSLLDYDREFVAADVAILTYWTKSSISGGIHNVAISHNPPDSKSAGILTYNEYTNWRDEAYPRSSISEFFNNEATGYDRHPIVVTFIYDEKTITGGKKYETQMPY